MILDGTKLAQDIKESLKGEVLELKKTGIVPKLAVILVSDDPASIIYVRNKERACQEIGIISNCHKLKQTVTETEILDLIKILNGDPKTHGILIQLPLPSGISEFNIINAINPQKDVDCFHLENIGKMFLGEADFYPCTPLGILELLKKYDIPVSGKDVAIVGMSNIVGKPLANILINAGATVIACHAKTKNLREKTLQADILVSAAGKPGLITEDMVKKNVVIVDVGMNHDSRGRIIGDVDFEKVSQIASAITPVPGGVGPMTVAMLMKNTIYAARNQKYKK